MLKEIFKKTYSWLILITVFAAFLRIPALENYPPALYSDEVSQGYNAYSISKTGRDEIGTWLPVSIRSFGDWKPPLQTYLMIPTIAIFGLTPLGIRLPSAILGTLTIFLSYFLVKELIKKFSFSRSFHVLNEKIALVTAILLAISPWHIMQSRSAMLVVVALFFTLLGLWSFLYGFKHPLFFFISSFSFVGAIYSYYGMRLIVPLLIFLLLILFRKLLLINGQMLGGALLFGILLLMPLIVSFIFQPNVIFGRAKTVSIFYDKGVALTVWDLIAQDGIDMPPQNAQFLHNKPYHYFVDIIKRFFIHLDGRFLFLIGDTHPPFQIPGMGIVYFIDGIFISFGLIQLLRHQSKLFVYLLLLISISLMPAAFTFVTPSQNRTFTMSFPLLMLSAIGIVSLIQIFKKKVLIVSIVLIIYGISFSFFAYNYTLILSTEHADWWHYGYKELTGFLKDHEAKYDTIYLSGQASVPYIFFLFYNQVDPNLIQKNIRRDLNDDEFGFEHVTSYGKYEFLRYFLWETDAETLMPNSLLALTGEESDPLGSQVQKVGSIFYPDGEVAFKLYEIH